jgi:hypothetical protein
MLSRKAGRLELELTWYTECPLTKAMFEKGRKQNNKTQGMLLGVPIVGQQGVKH